MDARGRCIQFKLPDSSSISYEYGDLHLEKITRLSCDGQERYSHAYVDFDQNGHVTKEDLICQLGLLETFHDLLERPEKVISPWHTAELSYGPSGLITSYENSFFGAKEYQYDPLNQLVQEGETYHSFDSLGNPAGSVVNHLNQIVVQDEAWITYDANGNPDRERTVEQSILYTYDALNRLVSITDPKKKRVEYVYDPMGRLYSKKETTLSDPSEKKHFYLYDKEVEIGTFDTEKRLLDLKVVGLGILGEIGGAVAIEVGERVYLPLHDFSGNVVALISSGGRVLETTDMDAFGKALSKSSINPWRFSSKRSEEHLVFYGQRFYSPFLGRFLTPDPSGSVESPNLYLFVRNSPLNRLDLFGLQSEDPRLILLLNQIQHGEKWYEALFVSSDMRIDALVCSDQLHKIAFTPEEVDSGVVNLLDHFHEITAKDGMEVSLITYHNGVNNVYEECTANFKSLMDKAPGSPLGVGLFHITEGLGTDVKKAAKEIFKIDTAQVAATRQIMVAFAKALDKVNPNAKWLHVAHSRGSGTGGTSIDGMTIEERALIKQKMIWIGVAGSMPLSNEKAHRAYNFYSIQDGITVNFAIGMQVRQAAGPLLYMLPSCTGNYNIEYLQCTSTKDQILFGMFDHSFLGNTLQLGLDKKIKEISYEHGFYLQNR